MYAQQVRRTATHPEVRHRPVVAVLEAVGALAESTAPCVWRGARHLVGAALPRGCGEGAGCLQHTPFHGKSATSFRGLTMVLTSCGGVDHRQDKPTLFTFSTSVGGKSFGMMA